LKADYQILIIFGTTIPDTTCHTNDYSSLHFTQHMLLQNLGKSKHIKLH